MSEVFARKRAKMLDALTAMGIRFDNFGRSTFYLWGDVSGLPEGINDGERLFRAALQERVMLVPGAYFDVNPGKARRGESRLARMMRFSFGPPEDNMVAGLERLGALIDRYR